jgi:prepilin-type N-terminal cleavage/methylation domain-containing protein
MMRMFRKDEGFTLVELMVVVLIIGILVAIAIPVFNAASKSARQRTCHSNQRTIEGAVQQWLAADPTNVWDTDGNPLNATGGRLIDGQAYVATNMAVGDPLSYQGAYLKDIPKCPIALGTQFYSTNASGTIISDGATADDGVATTNNLGAWLSDGGTAHGHF